MKNEDVKIGMKVVPFQKTAGYDDLENCFHWGKVKNNVNPFLYVVSKAGHLGDDVWALSSKIDDGGDYFNACDFEPYEEEKQIKSESYNILDENGLHIIQQYTKDEFINNKGLDTIFTSEERIDCLRKYFNDNGIHRFEINVMSIDIWIGIDGDIIKNISQIIVDNQKNKNKDLQEEIKQEPQYELFNASHWQDFLNDKIAVNFQEENDYNAFIRILNDMKIVWGSGCSLMSKNYFSKCECYHCNNNHLWRSFIENNKATSDDRKIVTYKKQQ